MTTRSQSSLTTLFIWLGGFLLGQGALFLLFLGMMLISEAGANPAQAALWLENVILRWGVFLLIIVVVQQLAGISRKLDRLTPREN